MDATRYPWLEARILRRLAVDAEADPRTVRRVLLGQCVKGMVAARIRRAALARGIPLLEGETQR